MAAAHHHTDLETIPSPNVDIGDLHYVVRGPWPFPKTMLGRDRAEPATEKDRVLIEAYTGEVAPDEGDHHEPVEIRLVIRDAGSQRPDSSRWASMGGWSVPADHVYHVAGQGRRDRIIRKHHLVSALAKLTADEIESLAWYGLRIPDGH